MPVNLPRCECKWYRMWQLPCAHIWHHHLMYKSLMPAHFARLADLWAKNGFEIYEELQQPFQDTLGDIIDVPTRPNLNFRVNVDTLVDQFYGLTSWLERKGAPRDWKDEGLGLFQEELSRRLVGFDKFSLEAWYQRKVSSREDFDEASFCLMCRSQFDVWVIINICCTVKLTLFLCM